jgi:ubiquinone/menaquinone biosynthesis C-methylase UbiE
MIRIARDRSKQYSNITFRIADASEWEFPVERFDCIVSIATLHHLPIQEMLSKMKIALRVNGTLVVLDLFQAEGLRDALANALAIPVNLVLGLVKNGRLRETRRLREAWAEHGQSDSYLTLSHIRQVCVSTLSGAKVRKHLLWRYSITWRKPQTPA